ncbi:hypothetical protein M2277_005005 [Paenibacillus sp. LBL]|uniref:hypothetical protein n=1 Tax=Paenibacillus sp. LBL TaxID=2940563 RepID=UPI0024735E77|nr:hypothetical protein [Paenibacillus sp. LBL]MDH6674313.1 hypothetical protein [Paenibacillus sp. LBL]
MNREVKCAYCGEKGKKIDMKVDEIQRQSGTTFKKNVHIACWDQYISNKQFLETEKKEREDLITLIAEIINIPINEVPSSFFPFIEQLRNGNEKIKGTKYKQGPTYAFIADVYEYCRQDIIDVRSYKSFDDVFGYLLYGLAIVKNNIYNVKRLHETQKIVAEKQDIIEQQIDIEHLEQEVEYKPAASKTSNDISDFLD